MHHPLGPGDGSRITTAVSADRSAASASKFVFSSRHRSHSRELGIEVLRFEIYESREPPPPEQGKDADQEGSQK